MSIEELNKKIKNKEAKIAVIGLGYVGLPVAALFAKTGFDVLGIDIKKDRVDKINSGLSPIEGYEPGLEELLAKVIEKKSLTASTDYGLIAGSEIILIDVETPVDEHNVPQYVALRSALCSLAAVIKEGALIIIESTIAPGTMKKVVQPILEEKSGKKLNQGFYLGNCPERVMPGKLLHNLQNLSRVVGGSSPVISNTMVSLYDHIVEADLDPTDWITAELVKTVENTYRDVQIAFANEMALICEALGGDVWKVRELVNKSPFRNMHLPGAGVGGHCIPKDPWLLAHGVSDHDTPLKMIPAARQVNDAMPMHMLDLLFQAMVEVDISLTGSTILVMGYAYLEGSDDIRNSPSKVLIERLKELGARIIVHDPYVGDYQSDLDDCFAEVDAAIIMVAHSEYQDLKFEDLRKNERLKILIDGRHVLDPEEVAKTKLIYRCVGKKAFLV